MRSEDIRSTFLNFFAEKGHKVVPSAPIVVKNDPTLLFTNAGMNQFKDYFLGNKQATDKRVADTQKCLRVSGKHNDLEEVGIDTYHHTMFEMLGNWSFGDYFKKDAISWAWELLTERFKMDKGRLYVTIFEGDEKEGLSRDNDSYNIWKGLIEESHILLGSKKDNFWEMGDTGPCGPCTEIHYDIRPDEERKQISGDKLVNNDHPQVIEIWNNVFIEFNRKADGTLEQLPDQHVDTGMGFERLTRVLQGKSSNYDTDIFQPLIRKMEADFQLAYGKDERTDIAFRVISDHIRAVTFTIADGQLPSNTGAGYVIRRILRRAVRYGYTFLGMNQPYIHQLVTVLAQQFKNVFPEVIQQEAFIKKVVQEEEASFLRTLATGTKLFEKHTETLQGGQISGKFAFELYDTYGFPFDLTQLMAREKNLDVDVQGFSDELRVQKDRSRQAAVKEEGDWFYLVENPGATKFIGYDEKEADVKITRYRRVAQKGEVVFHLVLDKTPFYAEGGGQIGDTGMLHHEAETVAIKNTYKENDLIIHVADHLPNDPQLTFHAVVDVQKQTSTSANHTATHLLHAALRKVLGTHVAQKGSLVNDKALRFDFSHFSKMSDEEIAKVEHIVNQKIREDIPLQEDRDIPIAQAQEKGAMALFGEKYGERVRMITFDPGYSVELCGGIHAKATGRLGFFKIISEGAVAAGVRRIEAVTGVEAERVIDQQFQLVKELKEALKNPKDLMSAIDQLRENNKELEKQLEQFKQMQIGEMTKKLVKSVAESPDIAEGVFIYAFTKDDNIEADAAKQSVINLYKEYAEVIHLLGHIGKERTTLWLYLPEKYTKAGLKAGDLIKEIGKDIDAKGGGQPNFATATAALVERSKLESVLEKGKALLVEKRKEKE
jgi:alanyl-tRNA synthetase